MADDAADQPAPPAFTQPYLVQQPDGSTATYLWHTDRQPTVGEVTDYAASRGQQFAGFPESQPSPAQPPAAAPPPAPPPPAAASPPAPQPPAAAPPPPPSASPGFGTVLRQTYLPETSPGTPREFETEVPSVIGATVAGGLTAAVPGAWPLAPFTAGAGSALGEAGRMGYEYL